MDKQYTPVSYGLGIEISSDVEDEYNKPFKRWKGSRGWRFVPRFLWGAMRRPYELVTFDQVCREAAEKFAAEMDAQIAQILYER